VIHHSDQGSQYVRLGFGLACTRAGISRSMGSVGDCYDNAVAETFFATLKKELVYRRSWPTRQELCSEVFEYIEGFCNPRRRHSTLGMLSPVQYEEQHAGLARFARAKNLNGMLKTLRVLSTTTTTTSTTRLSTQALSCPGNRGTSRPLADDRVRCVRLTIPTIAGALEIAQSGASGRRAPRYRFRAPERPAAGDRIGDQATARSTGDWSLG